MRPPILYITICIYKTSEGFLPAIDVIWTLHIRERISQLANQLTTPIYYLLNI